MGESCCSHNHDHSADLKFNENNVAFKRVLWLALILNLGMFFIEVFFGVLSHSLSLKADAIDFLGDSLNYFVSLFLIGSALRTKSRVSTAKALFMLFFGLWVLIEAFIRFKSNSLPEAFTMSWVGFLALVVNGVVALFLYKYKDGDSNMQSVWLCSRNDALGNLAVIFASGGVYWWGTKWPDLIVALFMSGLAVSASLKILKMAKEEFTHQSIKKNEHHH
jgi:cation diffusion facilitator family transporter